MKNHKKAFTLAEVLTTLMVIGVVAALTIPSMMNSYKKHTYVVGLKKAYSQISQAIKMIPTSVDCPTNDFECAGLTAEISKEEEINFLAKNFKTTKISTNGKCISDETNLLFGINPCILTADGMLYSSNLATNGIWQIFVDVNGETGPNKFGRDRFAFSIPIIDYTNPTKLRTIPAGTIVPHGSRIYADLKGNSGFYWRTQVDNPDANVSCSQYFMGTACTGRVLEEGKMNY